MFWCVQFVVVVYTQLQSQPYYIRRTFYLCYTLPTRYSNSSSNRYSNSQVHSTTSTTATSNGGTEHTICDITIEFYAFSAIHILLLKLRSTETGRNSANIKKLNDDDGTVIIKLFSFCFFRV